jgi:hypothetical protein
VVTAVGFFSFLPTDYRGLSELCEIGGFGMLIAFTCAITLVPAALAIFSPPGEERPMGLTWLAPLDRFFERHRMAVLIGTFAVVLPARPCCCTCRSTSTRMTCKLSATLCEGCRHLLVDVDQLVRRIDLSTQPSDLLQARSPYRCP